MKTPFSITDVKSDRISFRIGEDLGSYSCSREHGIRHGCIAVGGGNDFKVWCFNYDPLPWYGVVTDQDLIAQIKNQDKSYWMPTLIKSTLRIAAEADQLLWMVQKTVEMTEAAALLKGRKEQAKTIVASLGLDPESVSFNTRL